MQVSKVKAFYVNIGAIQNQSTVVIEVHESIKSMMLLHIALFFGW
jgi:hypothetical protein